MGVVAAAVALAGPTHATSSSQPAAAGAAIHTCHGEVATIVGTDGDDVLEGTPGPDVIVALKGSDIIHARGGDDVVCTGPSPQKSNIDEWIPTDLAYGGPGRDRLVGGSGNVALWGGRGRDVLVAHGVHTNLAGGPGNDELRTGDGARSTGMSGGAGDDVGYGGPSHESWGDDSGSDVFYGRGGSDSAYGGGPDGDRFVGGPGDDDLRGWTGADTLEGGSGDDSIFGYTGDDVLKGGSGRDLAHFEQSEHNEPTERDVRVNLAKGTASGLGKDRLSGIDDIESGGGNDTLIGDDGPNHFYLLAGDNDLVDGRGGQDTVVPDNHGKSCVNAHSVFVDLAEGIARFAGCDDYRAGLTDVENAIGAHFDDVLLGSAEANLLDGGGGDNDVIKGRAGADTLVQGWGNDQLDGGPGHDTADYSSSDAGVTLDLVAGFAVGDGNDGLADIENVIGSAASDELLGNAGRNVLHGLAGNDHLNGRAGDDELDGGPGADTLDGGGGDDVCTTSDGDARWRC